MSDSEIMDDVDEVIQPPSPTEFEIIAKMENELGLRDSMLEDLIHYMDYHSIFDTDGIKNFVPYKQATKDINKMRMKLRRTTKKQDL